ncbi:SWFGD domain-containing protein [Sphingomicrobium sp. XHP0239]|uniref:SWFGD domain-containing protein n=1 Tax=Sphingomicrobium maritimum TaxID=3133972 RepID=UPI0031CC8014
MSSRSRERYDREPRSSRENYDRDDRDFFDRAGDEVRSWFGDERAEARRNMDERYGHSGDGYRNQHFDFERMRNSNEGYRRPYTGRDRDMSQNSAGYGSSRFSDDNDQYGSRAEGRGYGRRQQQGRQQGRDFDRTDTYDYDRGYTQNRFSRPQTEGEFTGDRDYHEWRTRQIDALDNDYREWRRENQERFDDEFSSWRETRNSKRSQMSELNEGTTVVGSDGETIGTIQSIRGDRMIVKGEGETDSLNVFSCREFDRVENDQVMLNIDQSEARRRSRSDNLSTDRSYSDDAQSERMTNRSLADNY